MNIAIVLLAVVGFFAVVFGIVWVIVTICYEYKKNRKVGLDRFRKSIHAAAGQSLESAVTSLKAVGMEYRPMGLCSPMYPTWIIPKHFWKNEEPSLKAKALLTLINGAKKDSRAVDWVWVRDVSELLSVHSRKHRALAIAITFELAVEAGLGVLSGLGNRFVAGPKA